MSYQSSSLYDQMDGGTVTTLKLISKKQTDWETNFKVARTMSYQSSSLYDQMDGGKMTEEEEKAKQKT